MSSIDYYSLAQTKGLPSKEASIDFSDNTPHLKTMADKVKEEYSSPFRGRNVERSSASSLKKLQSM